MRKGTPGRRTWCWEVIRLAVMLYIRYPLSLRQVESLLFERGIDVCHGTVRYWWNRFGPLFAAEIRKRRASGLNYSNWRWHLDEIFVRINGERHYLWRAVDHEGEVLEAYVAKRQDRRALLEPTRGKRDDEATDGTPVVVHDEQSLRDMLRAEAGEDGRVGRELVRRVWELGRVADYSRSSNGMARLKKPSGCYSARI